MKNVCFALGVCSIVACGAIAVAWPGPNWNNAAPGTCQNPGAAQNGMHCQSAGDFRCIEPFGVCSSGFDIQNCAFCSSGCWCKVTDDVAWGTCELNTGEGTPPPPCVSCGFFFCAQGKNYDNEADCTNNVNSKCNVFWYRTDVCKP